MPKILKRIILLFLAILIFDIFFSFYLFDRNLKKRFPNLDYSQAVLGKASWYSKQDKGVTPFTASGEKFNDKKLTCASWDYPFGQRLVVINVMTGKWVACRVNDRGPNKRLNRVIDLTKSAFKKISRTDHGLAYVAVVPAGRYQMKNSK